jgi:hypothetical protein
MFATAIYDLDTTAWRPKLITVGDSFYWNILNYTPVWAVFESVPYWYYFSTVYFGDDDLNVTHKISDIDVLQEVIDADFVMLSYSTTALYKMSNGFSQSLLDKLIQNQQTEQYVRLPHCDSTKHVRLPHCDSPTTVNYKCTAATL